jgi:hypothetical protein
MMRTLAALALAAAVTGCSDSTDPAPARAAHCAQLAPTAGVLGVLGCGRDTARYTAEVAVRGNTAYTSSWYSGIGTLGNRISIWDVAGDTPRLVDSVIVDSTQTIGDIAISDDGRYLVAATEFVPGSIVVFDLADPRRPRRIARFASPDTRPGVHTAELGRVNGRLHAFLSVDRGAGAPSRMVIVDLGDPAAPRQIFTRTVGDPFVHDMHYRDGLLFLALWDDGIQLWDVGGGGLQGTVAAPVVMGGVRTVNGNAHNIWWFHDPVSGNRRHVFVGEEGPGMVGVGSSGDIHVVDISTPSAPREVAVYSVPNAGPHNFSVDEARGVLYAAFYNEGVRALDIRGDLSACTASQRRPDGRCDLGLMGRELGRGATGFTFGTYVWGVQFEAGRVFASDMLGGLWALRGVIAGR